MLQAHLVYCVFNNLVLIDSVNDLFDFCRFCEDVSWEWSTVEARYIALNVLADIGILALGFKFYVDHSYMVGRRLRSGRKIGKR